MTAPILEVRGLAKSFAGFDAVAGVTFALARGEVVALIGPNGAGKTTTFNLVNGQQRPDAGQVLIDGRDVTGLAPRSLARMGLGRTFQITATFASMTVAENLAVAIMAREGKPACLASGAGFADAEVRALLAQVGIAEAHDRLCAELSYGDLKRVDLALALAGRPRLLLMDEPTAGMAPKERGELMALTARLVAEQGLAVLFTEHDMGVVFLHAHRVLVMNRGRLVAAGTPAEVRANPTVRQVYLGHGPAGEGP